MLATSNKSILVNTSRFLVDARNSIDTVAINDAALSQLLLLPLVVLSTYLIVALIVIGVSLLKLSADLAKS